MFGDPEWTPDSTIFSNISNGINRDTSPQIGSITANGLENRSGHATGRSLLSKYMKPEHKRMSRVLGYCLTLGTPEAWVGFREIANARLDRRELGMLAYSALNTLDTELAISTARAVLGAREGPSPAFLGGMDDARFWASLASRHELKAYALACFEAMAPRDQAAFFQHISNIEVAA